MNHILRYIADASFEYDEGTSKAHFLWDREIAIAHLSSGTPPKFIILSTHVDGVLDEIKEYLKEKLKAQEDSWQSE